MHAVGTCLACHEAVSHLANAPILFNWKVSDATSRLSIPGAIACPHFE